MGATPKSRRERWNHICKKTGDCSYCRPHKGENGRKRPKQDRYKSKRKGR